MFRRRLFELHEDRARLTRVAGEQRAGLALRTAPFGRAWGLVEESFAWYRLIRRSIKVLAYGSRRCTRAPSRSPLGG